MVSSFVLYMYEFLDCVSSVLLLLVAEVSIHLIRFVDLLLEELHT